MVGPYAKSVVCFALNRIGFFSCGATRWLATHLGELEDNKRNKSSRET